MSVFDVSKLFDGYHDLFGFVGPDNSTFKLEVGLSRRRADGLIVFDFSPYDADNVFAVVRLRTLLTRCLGLRRSLRDYKSFEQVHLLLARSRT